MLDLITVYLAGDYLRFVNAAGELLTASILVASNIAGYGVPRPF